MPDFNWGEFVEAIVDEEPEVARPCAECGGTGWIHTGRVDEATGKYVGWPCEACKEEGVAG